MKKLIALEPEVYENLKKQSSLSSTKRKHEPTDKKVLSDLDLQMQQILKSDFDADQKIKLYNQALQKSKLFLRKTKQKELQKTTKPKLSDSEIISTTRKRAKAEKVLKDTKHQKNLDWDNTGQVFLDNRKIPEANILDLVPAVIEKRDLNLPGPKKTKIKNQNFDIPGFKEYESMLWESS